MDVFLTDKLRKWAHVLHPPLLTVSAKDAELSRLLINAAQEIEGRRPSKPEGKN